MPELHVAAYFGDLPVLIQRLLTDDPNTRSMNGNTPLMSAFYKKQKDAYKLLIRHGADPNLLNDDGEDVLSMILSKNSGEEWLYFAIHHGAKPHPLRHQGLLVWLVKQHALGPFEKILRLSPEMVDDTDIDGNTPLHMVLRHVSLFPVKKVMIDLLLRHGADVSQRNRWGLSPLEMLRQMYSHARNDLVQRERLFIFLQKFHEQKNAVWLYTVARVLQTKGRPGEWVALRLDEATPPVLEEVVCRLNPSLVQELARML